MSIERESLPLVDLYTATSETIHSDTESPTVPLTLVPEHGQNADLTPQQQLFAERYPELSLSARQAKVMAAIVAKNGVWFKASDVTQVLSEVPVHNRRNTLHSLIEKLADSPYSGSLHMRGRSNGRMYWWRDEYTDFGVGSKMPIRRVSVPDQGAEASIEQSVEAAQHEPVSLPENVTVTIRDTAESAVSAPQGEVKELFGLTIIDGILQRTTPRKYKLGRESEYTFESGLCSQASSDDFFPGRGESGKVARSVCEYCEIREDCLEIGLTEKFGIWGGLPESSRKKLSRAIIGFAEA